MLFKNLMFVIGGVSAIYFLFNCLFGSGNPLVYFSGMFAGAWLHGFLLQIDALNAAKGDAND